MLKQVKGQEMRIDMLKWEIWKKNIIIPGVVVSEEKDEEILWKNQELSSNGGMDVQVI